MIAGGAVAVAGIEASKKTGKNWAKIVRNRWGTVNQLNLTALKFSVLPIKTYLVLENLAFFQELSNGI